MPTTRKSRKLPHRHSIQSKQLGDCPITPARHRRLIDDLRTGDWIQMVALRNAISPDTIFGWVLRGLDDTAPKAYQKFADDFVRTEAEVSGELTRIVMDSALGRRKKPDGDSELEPPCVDDAKWMLMHRFSWLWNLRKDGTRGGKSVGEVVAARIEQMQAERRDEVRRILAQLPDEGKKQARKLGYMVP